MFPAEGALIVLQFLSNPIGLVQANFLSQLFGVSTLIFLPNLTNTQQIIIRQSQKTPIIKYKFNTQKMITSLSEDISSLSKRSALQDYQLVHSKLNNFIDKVNQKIVSRIHLVKQVYLDDYKEQVSIMSAELRAIRGVLDQQILKQRSNQRLFYLEEERDFFRAQVIKLNEDLKKLGEENNKLKNQLSEVKSEHDNLRKIVYDLETRIYKLTYENIQIDKLKQESKFNQTTTINSMTPVKGFTQRNNKNRYQSDKGSEKAIADREEQNESRLNRQKTHYSLRKLKPSHSLGATTPNIQLQHKNPEASSREQILDRCIKEVKKQIFYRNLTPQQANKINFDEEQKVSFEKFTKSDRKDLVYRFMSSPEILEEFYKFVFLRKKASKDGNELGALEKIAIAKGVDSRFNTKMLQNFKTQFDKRIYDIKANRY